jgi:nitroimidazol reductase NimA-like FMN-containing flavoprotein (pyridoxamine 5'-phosphate oxidase superfamily)
MTSYSPTERSRVKRAPDRGKYDKAAVFAIIDAALMCHIGYTIKGQPYVTPTFHWREGERLYWHGSSASRMIETIEQGVPVCFTASLLDGIVVARSGFHHSANYRAVMAFGTARLVPDAEKERSLELFMERCFPGRWPTLRPANKQEMKGTKILSMEIEEASAKVRTGPPKDDEEDYALPIWAGVVPVHTVIGAPENDPRILPGVETPAHIRGLKIG